MSDPQNAKTKCFSGILNLLLCKGSLPTHPSDHIITESNTTKFSDVLKKAPNTESKPEEVSATGPGIVARLMGLETLPDLDWVPKARLSDSFARSRSVNSMDYLIEFNPPLAHQHQHQHRRVRTSVSFREIPTVLSQQSQEYFVFYLASLDETKELGSKLRESEVGVAELNQKKTERSKNNYKEKNREKVLVKKKENAENKMKKSSKGKDEPRRVYGRHCSKVGDCHEVYRRPRAMPKAKSSSKKTVQQKAVPVVGLKFTEKKKKIQPVKEAQSKHDSNKSSTPVSVLDIQDILIHHECSLSEVSTVVDLNSRRKSSPKTSNFEYPTPQITRVSNDDCLNLGATKKKDKKTLKINGETEYYYMQLLGEICKLTQADLKEPYWVAEEMVKFEDFEDVCVEFGQQILDELLYQVVDELISGVSNVV